MPEPVTVGVLCAISFLVGGGIGHIVTKEIDTYMLHTQTPSPERSPPPHHYTDEEERETPMADNPLRRDRTFRPAPFLVGDEQRDDE